MKKTTFTIINISALFIFFVFEYIYLFKWTSQLSPCLNEMTATTVISFTTAPNKTVNMTAKTEAEASTMATTAINTVNSSHSCNYSSDLGPLWRRSGFKDFKSWQLSIKINTLITNLTYPRLFSANEGAWKPPNCTSSNSVAIIIPFRDREDHLRLFLNILHPFLQRQKMDYQVFVIEQGGDKNKKFNKGKLYNVGFKSAVEIRPDINCFFFHDVDLVPEDERILYNCDEKGAKHFGSMVDTLNYTPMYSHMLGGVLAVTKKQFTTANGFSNKYWGWGGEDDDFGLRLQAIGIPALREDTKNSIYHYTMLTHKNRRFTNGNPKRYRMLAVTKRVFKTDGLNSLSNAEYSVERLVKSEEFVHIIVDVKNER